MQFKQYPKTPLKLLFTAAGADTLELLESMLIYDPNRRISAREVSSRKHFESVNERNEMTDNSRVFISVFIYFPFIGIASSIFFQQAETNASGELAKAHPRDT
jgi:hypothetical protein